MVIKTLAKRKKKKYFPNDGLTTGEKEARKDIWKGPHLCISRSESAVKALCVTFILIFGRWHGCLMIGSKRPEALYWRPTSNQARQTVWLPTKPFISLNLSLSILNLRAIVKSEVWHPMFKWIWPEHKYKKWSNIGVAPEHPWGTLGLCRTQFANRRPNAFFDILQPKRLWFQMASVKK